MQKDKIPKEDRKIMSIKENKILIPIIIGVAIATIGTIAVIAYTQAQTGNPSTPELINTITPIRPPVIVVKDKVGAVNGVSLAEAARTSTSTTIERVDGESRFASKDGQAELSLLHSLDPLGQHIIAVTITNTGTSPFHLTALTMEAGNSETRIFPLSAHAVDMLKGVSTVENYPKAPITEPVNLNPKEALSAYIVGTWNIVELDKKIDVVNVGAIYYYELGLQTYKPGNVWSMGISDYRLP